MEEKDFILKGIKLMEDLKPSEMNPARWLSFKIKFLPRLKAFINGETEKVENQIGEAKKIFEIKEGGV